MPCKDPLLSRGLSKSVEAGMTRWRSSVHDRQHCRHWGRLRSGAGVILPWESGPSRAGATGLTEG